ncbi:MAG: hypothetical protein JO278_05785 [Dyella sp.]|nr:hypothetical protein [Dyella sp.]
MMRRSFIAATAAVALCTAAPVLAQNALAQPGPIDGTVTISARSVAVGVGYTWGDGILVWHHHTYPFMVRGVSVADVGFATVVGHGRVYNLHNLADFSGTYGSAEGNATIVNGIGGQFLQNGRGVQIRIDQVSHGAKLTGAADGVQLTLR